MRIRVTGELPGDAIRGCSGTVSRRARLRCRHAALPACTGLAAALAALFEASSLPVLA